MPQTVIRLLTVTATLTLLADLGPFRNDVAAQTGPRIPWTTSNVTGTPDPPLPFVTERAFPNLQFNQCLDLAPMPGSNRLFVLEQGGKLFSFPQRADVASADLVIDLAKAIPGAQAAYALTFHPNFLQNRYCYICYILAPELPDGTHVARFRVTESDPPTIDPASETTIITWLSGGHNGCCLKFGPDGHLYISTGDGTGPNPPDVLRAGQDVRNLLSAILRIDVDHPDEGKPYRIPSDNPFVDLEGARGEIWAYGFRNPWRMSFDRQTGDLWVGDVGWELWEMLDRVERGGNYGWSVMEGRQPTNPEWPRGPTPILPPTLDHPHSESSSITDGLTYYGQQLPELHGMHLYGDYDTGKIWGFRWTDGRVTDHRELADTTHRIVGFGEDAAGELYLLDHTAGTLHRMIPNPRRDQASSFPRTLTETGLFATTAEHTPAPGVLPYAVLTEPWADGATTDRFVAVPEGRTIKTEPAGKAWTFPPGSVLLKTFSLPLDPKEPGRRQRIETQLLHFDGQEWRPYTYAWNAEQTDATLVPADGAETILAVVDPGEPGGIRQQRWRWSGRSECQRCHNPWSGPPLGFTAAQLHRDLPDGSGRGQLQHWAELKLLDSAATPPPTLPPFVNAAEETAPLDARARAYLHANCAHCHRMHAGSAVLSKMPYDLPLDKTDMVGTRPTQGTFGLHGAQVIVPSDPFRSVLWYRMSKLGGGRMPHLGSMEVDRAGIALIHDWIKQLPSPEPAAAGVALQLRADDDAALERLRTASNLPEQTRAIERLLSCTSGALLLVYHLEHGELDDAVKRQAIDQGRIHTDVNVRDLFERYVPLEQRVRRLGTVVQAEAILSLSGDPQRGEQLFWDGSGVACKSCHRIGDRGKDVGPPLTTIAKNNDPVQLLDSILYPSRKIDPKYLTYLVETRDGRQASGILVERSAAEVVLKDVQDQLLRFPLAEVERLVPQQQSLMPELLVRDLTAQQVADLLAYLSTLQE